MNRKNARCKSHSAGIIEISYTVLHLQRQNLRAHDMARRPTFYNCAAKRFYSMLFFLHLPFIAKSRMVSKAKPNFSRSHTDLKDLTRLPFLRIRADFIFAAP